MLLSDFSPEQSATYECVLQSFSSPAPSSSSTPEGNSISGEVMVSCGCGGVGIPLIWFLLLLSYTITVNSDVWAKPGCHVVGHTRKIRIPNCVEFQMTTNACRGYCESWAVPTTLEALLVNPNQPITSIAQCCNMMDTEDIQVSVLCLGGIKELTFKSAKSCSCFHCKKD